MNEKRKIIRSRKFVDGKIYFSGQVITCTVFDLSETGARIGIFQALALPNKFMFSCDEVSLRTVELRWQDGNVFGLEFV